MSVFTWTFKENKGYQIVKKESQKMDIWMYNVWLSQFFLSER
jgi:hypothetical protein